MAKKKTESHPIPDTDIESAKDIGNQALKKLKKRGLVKRTEDDGDSPDKFRAAVLFVFMIFFLLLVFVEGSAGWQLLHKITRGVFGVTTLLVPILIGMAAWKADSDDEDAIQATAKWNVIITIIISGAVQVLFTGDTGENNLFKYIKYLYEDGIENTFGSGGVVSAILSYPLLTFFGTTGARIVIILILLMLMFWISKKSPRDLIYMMTHPMGDPSSNDKDEEEVDEFNIPMDYTSDGGQFTDSSYSDYTPEPAPREEPKKQKSIGKKLRDFFFPASQEEEYDDTGIYSQDIRMPAYKADYPDSTDDFVQDPAAQPTYDDMIYPPAPEAAPKGYGGELDSIIRDTRNPNAAAPEGINAEINTPYGMPTDEEEAAQPVKKAPRKPRAKYKLPPMQLLKNGSVPTNPNQIREELSEKASILMDTLKSFNVDVRISGICPGPSVTRYEIQPAAGVKVSKITGLADDIALALAANGVRIEAPIPGKSAIGIEVPNTTKDTVALRDILESDAFKNSKSKLTFALGKDIAGSAIVGDVAKMPHMIIAGTTGSGKSVCTNSIIMSFLMNASPDEVKLILIDPKIVEFRVYEGIPHLLIPVVTDPKKAAGALNWAVQEMLRRYKQFAENNVRDIYDYNEKAGFPGSELERMPQIVIAIDELADLMMAASKEVEDSICRLAQMARAAGMHLIIATQRPTTDIITGLIKANIPSRIALSVKSQIDSRTILDVGGAEKLLGHGDMLYVPNGVPKPVRVQGCYTSTAEIERVVDFVKDQCQQSYDPDIMQEVEESIPVTKADKAAAQNNDDFAEAGSDAELIEKAIDIVVQAGQASTSALQRRLKLGYARAARIMDELEGMGIIGPYEGAKPRRVLLTPQQNAERRAQK